MGDLNSYLDNLLIRFNCSECEVFDCCKLICYRYVDEFVLVFVSLKEGQTTSRPFYFNISILIGRSAI